MMKVLYTLACCSLLLFTSCDREEAVPSYIHIPEVTFETVGTQGSASSDFRYVEIFSGIEQIGLFHLPATVPILAEGNTELNIFPGVNDNGIAATPLTYSLVKASNVEVNLVPGEVLDLPLSTTYKDNLEFVFVEEFESDNQIFREELDEDPITKVELTNEDVFEGNRSGSLIVSDENPLLVVASTLDQNFPPGGVPIYLELNFKTEIPFEIGLSWFSTSIGWEIDFRNVLNPTDEWKKIYINYTEPLQILNTLNGIQGWQVVIRARMPEENGTVVQGTREVLLDNFKVIHIN